MTTDRLQIALIGNPNSGKSSLFNILTGLRQTVSNFPGVTVDKKIGVAILDDGRKVDIIDFPGLYSLHPNSSDEKLVVNVLSNTADANYPDLVIYVADATNLERHLLLATQLLDLGMPMVFAINMIDIIEAKNQKIDTSRLADFLQVPVIQISGRSATNIEALKYQMMRYSNGEVEPFKRKAPIVAAPSICSKPVEEIQQVYGLQNEYLAKIWAHHHMWLSHIEMADKIKIKAIAGEGGFDNIAMQIDETMQRYGQFSTIARKTISASLDDKPTFTDRIDQIVTHRFFGPLIFFGLMLFMFQAIYAWSELPMGLIEQAFNGLGSITRSILPEGWFANLIVEGIIAGLGGVLIFIPQITILFLLVAILEETGYMSRAVFMFDGIMQRFGLNGRSIVALVSSGACAIPAIMSTRTISSWKERLNTILVAPLISCSARIPVYTVLIGFVVPEGSFGIFNYRGLVFMGLYLLGIMAAMGSALAFKYILKADQSTSYLMIELPQYKPPIWKNAFLSVKEKVTTFVLEAGKVILIISILLWFMASYGPSQAMKTAEVSAAEQISSQGLTGSAADDLLASQKIEASYAGHIGKFIEPAIKPLGFDWKIGIALITSFAAREVFVGTMATIYSVGSADDEATVHERMDKEIDPVTKLKRYSPATALSLLIFYVFAMQCMSTLAVTRRETKSWKWPTVQFFYMGALAYFGSLITYQVMSAFI